MNDLFDSPESKLETPNQPTTPSVPKLSIADLMIWTACVAIYVAVYQLNSAGQGELLVGVTRKMLQLGFAMVCGTATAGVLVLVRNHRFGEILSYCNPGHVLLFAISVAGISSLIAFSCLAEMRTWEQPSIQLILIIFSLHSLAIMAVIIFALFVTAGSRWHFCLYPWLLFRGCTVIDLVGEGILQITVIELAPIQLIGSFFGMGLVFVLIIADLMSKQSLTWLHRLGTVCLLGIYTTEFASVLLMLIFKQQ